MSKIKFNKPMYDAPADGRTYHFMPYHYLEEGDILTLNQINAKMKPSLDGNWMVYFNNINHILMVIYKGDTPLYDVTLTLVTDDEGRKFHKVTSKIAVNYKHWEM